jgi:4-oxalocrotonate tautomerase
MPLLQLHLAGPSPTTAQTSALQTGLTQLMADILGKRADLTVVQVTVSPAECWSRGGLALRQDQAGASLVAHITAGTNSAAEQAAFVACAHALITQTLPAAAAAPVYVIVQEVPATAWGYDGRTQQARRALPATPAPAP